MSATSYFSDSSTSACIDPPDAAPSFSGILTHLINNPKNGVVGFVDDLLSVCQKQEIELDWQADQCCTRSFGGNWKEMVGVQISKSIFRAALARIAVLCNESALNPVSLYGGRSQLSVGTNPLTTFDVDFINTTAKQSLKLTINHI